MCCNGSLQFGADDPTGAWQRICLESTVRSFAVRNLELLVGRIAELLGVRVELIIVPPFANVLQTIQYMETFIGRVCSQPEKERISLKSLFEHGQQIQIVNNYCELMSLDNGAIIQIPCNVDLLALKQFLSTSNNSARLGDEIEGSRRKFFENKMLLEAAKTECIKHLELSGLSWDANLSDYLVLNYLQKLRRIEPEKIGKFSRLQIHLSSGPRLLVLSSGKILVPIQWIDQL